MNRYLILIVLVGIFFLVELGVGLVANSLALQTDAFHMLSDLMALIIAYLSFRMSKKGKTIGFTYGWLRAEIIGGLINSVFLLAICFSLIIEFIGKFIELKENDFQNQKLAEQIDLVMIAAAVGLVVNLIGLALFHQDHQNFHHHHEHQKQKKKSNLIAPPAPAEPDLEQGPPEPESDAEVVVNYNNYAVFLHVLGDTLGSVVVLGSGLLIRYLESKWRFLADPLASALIIIFIVASSVKLFRACALILLHQTPVSLDYDQLIFELKKIPGVEDLHDIHIWPLNTNIVIATLHVKIRETTLRATDHIITEVKNVLHRYGIHVSSIQPEFGKDCLEPECQEDKCLEKQCCQ